ESQEAGHDLFGHVDAGLYLGDARIVVVRLGLRDRTGLVDLPGERGAQLRILGEQVVEDRGPGPRLTDDEDRRRDRLVGNLGILLAPSDYAEPVLQGAHDVEVGDLDADLG